MQVQLLFATSPFCPWEKRPLLIAQEMQPRKRRGRGQEARVAHSVPVEDESMVCSSVLLPSLLAPCGFPEGPVLVAKPPASRAPCKAQGTPQGAAHPLLLTWELLLF